MNYGCIPSSWGAVFRGALQILIGAAIWFAIVVICANVVGHLTADVRSDRVCWYASGYIWPIDGWTERYVCVDAR